MIPKIRREQQDHHERELDERGAVVAARTSPPVPLRAHPSCRLLISAAHRRAGPEPRRTGRRRLGDTKGAVCPEQVSVRSTAEHHGPVGWFSHDPEVTSHARPAASAASTAPAPACAGRSSTGTGQGHRPVRALVVGGAGEVGALLHPEEVLERGERQRGRAAAEAAVDLDVDVVGRARSSSGPTRRSRRARIAGGASVPRHIPARVGRSWVVTMASDWAGHASGGLVLEPHDLGGQDPPAVELVAEPLLDGAEVLADDERPRRGRSRGRRARAARARRSARRRRRPASPPSGTQNRRVSPITWSMRSPPPRDHRGAEQGGERPVARVAQPPRDPRRQPPRLARRSRTRRAARRC